MENFHIDSQQSIDMVQQLIHLEIQKYFDNRDSKLDKKIKFELERERLIKSMELEFKKLAEERNARLDEDHQNRRKQDYLVLLKQQRMKLIFRITYIVAILIFALTALFLFYH